MALHECGWANDANDRYCGQCGDAIAGSAPDPTPEDLDGPWSWESLPGTTPDLGVQNRLDGTGNETDSLFVLPLEDTPSYRGEDSRETEAGEDPARSGADRRIGLVAVVRGRVEDQPEVSATPRGANPAILALLFYWMLLLIRVIAFPEAAGWQVLAELAAVLGLGAILIFNFAGFPWARLALGSIVATPDVWGRRQVPVTFLRVNAGNGPMPVMIANTDHGFKHGDEVDIKGYRTMRGLRASQIRNHTTGQRVWDTQPLARVALMVFVILVSATDLSGMVS